MKNKYILFAVIPFTAIILFLNSCQKTELNPDTTSGKELKAGNSRPPRVLAHDIKLNTTGISVRSGADISLSKGAPPIIERGLVWSTYHWPTLENNTGIMPVDGGTGSFDAVIEGLTENQLYYIRAYARNADGLVYGIEEPVAPTSGSTSASPCETFTDQRDGKQYRTVLIGTQCWMAENLNYGTMNVQKKCYNDLESNCTVYGGMYDWNTAMNGEPVSTDNPSGVQGICPNGWHLPSLSEICQLNEAAGGKTAAGGALKERGFTHWNKPNEGATNSSGFTALGAGLYTPSNGYGNLKMTTAFWGTSEFFHTGTGIMFKWSFRETDKFGWNSINYQYDYFWQSVRCIKDPAPAN